MSEEKMERWRYPRFFTENISDTSAVLNAEDSGMWRRCCACARGISR